MKMVIVGTVASEEEKEDLSYAVKIFLVGQRIQDLSRNWRIKNEVRNQKKNQ